MEIQLSKDFVLSEFNCKDGTPVPEIFYGNLNTLVFNLQVLRTHIKKPIIITSGYRTIGYNKSINASKKSKHLTAEAADFKVIGIRPKTIYSIIEQLIQDEFMKQGGLGLYDTFNHYDIRGHKCRWTL